MKNGVFCCVLGIFFCFFVNATNFETEREQTVFTVTSSSDDGQGGSGTLSQAIDEVNDSHGGTITFAVNTVNVTGSLPSIRTGNVLIDGTLSGGGKVTISASSCCLLGFAFIGDPDVEPPLSSIMIRNMTIQGFEPNGIFMIHVVNSIIGPNLMLQQNRGSAVDISGFACIGCNQFPETNNITITGNTIQDTKPATGNNPGFGVFIHHNASMITVENNLIELNDNDGIVIFDAATNTIKNNMILDNATDGMEVVNTTPISATTNNIIENNEIVLSQTTNCGIPSPYNAISLINAGSSVRAILAVDFVGSLKRLAKFKVIDLMDNDLWNIDSDQQNPGPTNTIIDNNVLTTTWGGIVGIAATGSKITGNNIQINSKQSCNIGISLASDNFEISSLNTIQGGSIGIQLAPVTESIGMMIKNNTIKLNNIGIAVAGGTPKFINTNIQCNEITSNQIGVEIRNTAQFLQNDGNKVKKNNIRSNSTYGLINRNSVQAGPNDDIDAERNFWGSPIGPKCDSNETGGDLVIDCKTQNPLDNNEVNVDVRFPDSTAQIISICQPI